MKRKAKPIPEKPGIVLTEAAIIRGAWENGEWELNESIGKLIISGNGPMEDFLIVEDDSSLACEDSYRATSPWCQKREKIVNVEIKEGVTKIGDYAFWDCGSLTNIDIPSSVAYIGKGAFHGSGLIRIKLPVEVKNIGNGAFWSCRHLTGIDIPLGVTYIGNGTFGLCISLTSIDIPSGVTRIGSAAFSYCENLTNICRRE